MLPLIAHPCVVGLDETMNIVLSNVEGYQRAGLNKNTQAHRTGSPSSKKELESELSELK